MSTSSQQRAKEEGNKEKDKTSSILVEVINAEIVRHPDNEVRP